MGGETVDLSTENNFLNTKNITEEVWKNLALNNRETQTIEKEQTFQGEYWKKIGKSQLRIE